jgi:GNAT superfamily N-acetyltransferase
VSKATDSTGLAFRQDYFADRTAWNALVRLLDDTFAIDIGPLMELGGPDPTSMPFGWFTDDGILAANLSAFAMPVVINGRRIRAAGLQSGAVRPPWRGRGLYRDVTLKALAWCQEQGSEAIILYTDKPGLYVPYGFRTLPMHCYRGAAPLLQTRRRERFLDPLDGRDLTLLQSLLESRESVSATLAVVASPAMFLINTQLDPGVRLSYLEEFRAAIAWKMRDDGTFVLLDVVAPVIPSLSDILGGLGLSVPSVAVHFRPDRLGWEGEAVALDGGTCLMIRSGEAISPDAPAMLSPMADF